MVALGELTKIRTGKLDANAANQNGVYPFFTCAVEPLLINTAAFDCKAVLVAGNGDLNVKYYEGKFNAYQRTYVIESLDEKKLYPKYLYLFLDKYVAKLREQAIGGVIKYIKLGNLTDAKIPLPPLAEQKRIAAILDKSAEIKAKREQAIAKLDELGQSTLIEMFGDVRTNSKNWEQVTLDEIAVKITDGEHLTPRRTNEGIKLLSARNVRDGYLSFESVDYVDEVEYQRISKRCKPEYNDILISCSGSIGRVSLIKVDEPLALVRSAALVKPNVLRVNPEYLESYLRSAHMKAVMLSKAKSSSQANLFQAPIKSLIINLPPLQLQDDFENLIKSQRNLKLRLINAVENLTNLISSLQHQAFTTGFNA